MESYEKKYKEALEIAKKNYDTAQDLCNGSQIGVECFKNTLTNIFPELKESEDEKIRKELIDYINRLTASPNNIDKYNAWITWLEKQGEESPLPENKHERVIKALKEGFKYHQLFNPTFGGIPCIEIVNWLENIFSKKDVDDAYLKGVIDTKNEIEKQYEANYQIRKDIATFIFNYRGVIKDRAKWMDYLGIKVSFVEKQSEQKSVDKIEPKFKVGDWITNGLSYPMQISSIEDGMYYTHNDTVGGDIESMDKEYHLWTIQDAKDGDILCYETKDELRIFIYKNGYIHYHCHYCNEHLTTVDSFFVAEKYLLCYIHPATQEQRDLLFQKMKDAGYEWDAEKKELKKSNSYCQEHCKGFQETGKCFADGDCKAKIEAEQKPVWSEEDEKMLVDAYVMLDWYKGNNWWTAQYIKDWLKSLKERFLKQTE